MRSAPPTDPFWIAEADVAALVDLGAAIAAIEPVLCAEGEGGAESMLKTHVAWRDGGTLHALGGVHPAGGWAGTKTWAHTAGGASPLLLLFDSRDGALRAVIEAFGLGQLRTAAVSALATDRLALAGAERMAIVGSGRQALAQVAAVAAVRRLARVDVYSPTRAHAEEFATRARERLGLAAAVAESVRAAVADAPVVTVVTRAREPFLTADMLASGAHLNAVGAITPERAELAGDVLAGCELVAVDSVATARRLSRELRDRYDASDGWGAVASLAAVLRGEVGRGSDAGVTLFKAMGLGLADLALGIEVVRRARAAGRGRAIPPPRRAEIDWRA